ncbi:hypothetical protein EGW08_001109 [Elysia chlorotica]|uniref:G-protein coupled receptors family 1 profile domain-containing protein n=1 Tax=Elysia chlorotica TaxID=188477 RepID=A0A433UB89_ELYCH|nr:hypothetical protein EGW08_001109 [Elysia chlorotica]
MADEPHTSHYHLRNSQDTDESNVWSNYGSTSKNNLNNVNDDKDYYQYEVSPFDIDRDFALSLKTPSNKTRPIDAFSSEPWGPTSFSEAYSNSRTANININDQHSNDNTASMSLQHFYNSSLPNVLFDRLHTDQDFLTTSSTTAATLTTSTSNSTLSLDAYLNSTADSQSGDIYTWSILMMAPLVVFGVAGNTLVILAISLEKRLQNVTNYFLLSLAVTDLLVSLIVMPLSIINVFTGRWLFGLLLCDFFVTSDVLMCTSSILHLCTISLERYIGIRYPLWTKNKSKRVVLLKIVLVWTIALAITSPITVLGVIRENNVLVQGECVLSNEHFIIYGSIFAFFIPLTIMVVMYALTVRMLNAQARLCQGRRADDREGQPMIRRSTARTGRAAGTTTPPAGGAGGAGGAPSVRTCAVACALTTGLRSQRSSRQRIATRAAPPR